MLNKIIRIFEITLVGIALFASSPLTGYAYSANVTTIPATNISSMNATLNGFVNTGGVAGSAWFEYGTDTSFGNTSSLNASKYNNSYAGNFSANISGLTANTTYYFRAVALNSSGIVYGNVLSFVTTFSISGNNNLMSPSAMTTSGVVLDSTTAQFNALILLGNSNTANTYFEYGTTVDLGNQTGTIPLSGSPSIRHTETIPGLAPSTTYFFRAVAENSYGRSVGTILSLVTNPKTQNSVKTVINKTTDTNSSNSDNQTTALSALGVNVFGSGSFFPVNIFGWLMLLILILILVLLSKHVHSEFIGKKQLHQPPHH